MVSLLPSHVGTSKILILLLNLNSLLVPWLFAGAGSGSGRLGSSLWGGPPSGGGPLPGRCGIHGFRFHGGPWGSPLPGGSCPGGPPGSPQPGSCPSSGLLGLLVSKSVLVRDQKQVVCWYWNEVGNLNSGNEMMYSPFTRLQSRWQLAWSRKAGLKG